MGDVEQLGHRDPDHGQILDRDVRLLQADFDLFDLICDLVPLVVDFFDLENSVRFGIFEVGDLVGELGLGGLLALLGPFGLRALGHGATHAAPALATRQDASEQAADAVEDLLLATSGDVGLQLAES